MKPISIGINEFRTDMGRVLEIGQQVSSQTSLSEFKLAVSVDELANLAAKYETMPSSAFQTAVDALNKVSLSQETVNSLSMSTIQSMLTMDVHKDTLFNYALNGKNGDLDHKMGKSILKNLPELIKNPVAIISSETHPNDSVVAIVSGFFTGTTRLSPFLNALVTGHAPSAWIPVIIGRSLMNPAS